MNILKRVSIFMLLFAWLPLTFVQGQTARSTSLPDEVIEAMQQGDAGALSPFMNNRIELLLPGKSGVFSKEQARFIIKDFFEEHPVNSFQVLHQGARENSTFAIGRYTCRQGQYRVYFLIKSESGSINEILIHQIRIEKQDD